MTEEWEIQVKFLPPYSPEFNPCELVFSLVKTHLRNSITSAQFIQEIARGFSQLTQDSLRKFYAHCIDFLFVNGLHIPPGAL